MFLVTCFQPETVQSHGFRTTAKLNVPAKTDPPTRRLAWRAAPTSHRMVRTGRASAPGARSASAVEIEWPAVFGRCRKNAFRSRIGMLATAPPSAPP